MSLPYWAKTDFDARRVADIDVVVACSAGTVASSSRRLHSVEASSPKNVRRMLLSMPTTSKPLPLKKRTASAPISPADPVTIATLMRYFLPGTLSDGLV